MDNKDNHGYLVIPTSGKDVYILATDTLYRGSGTVGSINLV